MRRIPIANVYYLLSYAWRHVEEADIVDAGELSRFEHMQDLLGEVLARGAFRIIRKGLDRGYREVREDLRGIRGKLLLSDYAKRGLRAKGLVPCEYEELSHDIQHNRILKTSLRSLLLLRGLDRDVRDRVRTAYSMLDGVTEIRLDRGAFRQVQLDGNRSDYRFLMSICALLHEQLGVEEDGVGARFIDFRDDYERMWQLFEHFVREFFAREQDAFSVNRRGREIAWHQGEDLSEQDRALIPRMEADVILEGEERRIILDTKYYVDSLQRHWGRPKLHSAHLYQLLAYLRNREATAPAGPRHEGILLYPLVEDRLATEIELEGFRIRAWSIDLAQPWEEIHADLLRLLAA